MIKPAHIEWSDETPISAAFDDVYFSKASGIDETRYVFLQQNHLAERWQTLFSHTTVGSSPHFTIAETGFGTGLNFLCAWQLWQQIRSQCTPSQQAASQASPSPWLHFVSVEKFPLMKESLAQALAHWPELAEQSEKLLAAYPPLVDGWHTLTFAEDNLVLHLFLGDIKHWLPNIRGQVDAWFLDGFAPSKNPEMWDATLFDNMARLTANNGTAATFTSAGLVKRGLKGAGFSIKKVKGFGHKREMLTAQFNASCGPRKPAWLNHTPWFNPSPVINSSKPNTGNKPISAIVIGGGIAGCASAYALAKRGVKVTLLEQNTDIALGGSGNPQGVLYAKLSADMNAHSQFYLAGYLHSLRLLNELMPDKQHWRDCGVLQLAFNEKEAKRQQQFNARHGLDEVVHFVDAEQASAIAGTAIEQSGLFFPKGGWVSPRHWCQRLTQHDNIKVLCAQHVTALTQLEETVGETPRWQVRSLQNDQAQTFDADMVVIANAHMSRQLQAVNFLPTKALPGQVTKAQLGDAKATETSISLNTVLCGASYVAPSHDQQLVFGATYRLKSEDESIQDSDNQINLENLNKDFPSVGQQLSSAPALTGRAATRCTVPDYTPVAGAVLNPEHFNPAYADLKNSKNWTFDQPAHFLSGLYLNCGHGSRGLSSAPLCAELITAQALGEPWPLPAELADVLSPSRFLVKALTP